MNWIDFNGDPSDGCEKKIEKKSGTPTASDENNGDGVGSDGSSSSSTTKGKKMLTRPTVMISVYVRVYLSCVIKIHLMKKIKVL